LVAIAAYVPALQLEAEPTSNAVPSVGVVPAFHALISLTSLVSEVEALPIVILSVPFSTLAVVGTLSAVTDLILNSV